MIYIFLCFTQFPLIVVLLPLTINLIFFTFSFYFSYPSICTFNDRNARELDHSMIHPKFKTFYNFTLDMAPMCTICTLTVV